jgi:outer membrane protein assembly factor BamB
VNSSSLHPPHPRPLPNRERGRSVTKFLYFIFIFPLLSLSNETAFAFRDLGIPVKEAICLGVHTGVGKRGERDTIYLSFGQYNAPLFLLAVNPDTGEMRQFNGPLSSEMGAWGFTIDHENRIYLGSYYHAHLLRFDPETERWDDLGQPGGEAESFVCALTTAPDGKIWGGTFPSAILFSYDPKSGKSENFGRMDPEQFYCYPTAGEDGLVYCAIQFAKVDIVVFDPKNQTRTSLIPSEDRKPGRVSLVKGNDGKIYARLSPSDQWYRIEEREKLIGVSKPDIPSSPPGLPDGRKFQLIENKILRIQNPSTKEEKEISLEYEASGAFIFVVGLGPDGRIYGSSMLPLRLFVYDPKDGLLTNLGKAAFSTGESYSTGVLGDKLYLCSYPGARLSVYDPKRPLRFGPNEGDNPRDLGPIGEDQDRPRAMIAGPYGMIYIGSYPDYGQLGGAISVYDPKTGEKRVYRHIVQNQSIASLAYIEKFDLIAAGSSVKGGGGTRAVEREAKLILLSAKEEKKVFEVIPVSGAKTILSLAATMEGKLYGTTDNEKIFVFDAEKGEVQKVFDLEFKEPIEISLQSGPEDKLYGLSKEAIFFIDPKDDRVSLLAKSPVPITSGMAILDRRIYYGSDANLFEFEIPLDLTIPPQVNGKDTSEDKKTLDK